MMLATFGTAPARATTTDEIISRGKVIVAIDTTTAPYGMVDESMQPSGFDIEVANLVGKSLGVPVEFVTVTSPGRIPSLLTNRVDMVISIFSITPERALQVAFSIPYAGQSSVVLAPKSVAIKGPEDLVGLKVGVTRGTGEDGLLTAQAEKSPASRSCASTTTPRSRRRCCRARSTRWAAATTAIVPQEERQRRGFRAEVRAEELLLRHRGAQGQPRALAVAQHLHLVAEERRRPERPVDEVSQRAASRAAGVLSRSRGPGAPARACAFRTSGHGIRLSLRSGAEAVAAAALGAAAHAGALGAVDDLRLRDRHPRRDRQDLRAAAGQGGGDRLCRADRNTPLLIQLYFIFFTLPFIGLRLSSDTAAVVALSIHLGAYATEIVRAGIEFIPPGQIEAGRSLGLSGPQIIRFIVIKPAIRAVYPALGGQFILQLLGSSIVSAIAAEELTAIANNLVMQTFRNFEIYIVVAVIYFVVVQVFILLFPPRRAVFLPLEGLSPPMVPRLHLQRGLLPSPRRALDRAPGAHRLRRRRASSRHGHRRAPGQREPGAQLGGAGLHPVLPGAPDVQLLRPGLILHRPRPRRLDRAGARPSSLVARNFFAGRSSTARYPLGAGSQSETSTLCSVPFLRRSLRIVVAPGLPADGAADHRLHGADREGHLGRLADRHDRARPHRHRDQHRRLSSRRWSSASSR